MSEVAALVAFAAGSLALPFFRARANRAATGTGVYLFQVAPEWAYAIVAAAALCGALAWLDRAARPRGLPGAAWRQRAFALFSALPGPLALCAMAFGARSLSAGLGNIARVSFDSGFWVALAAAWALARTTRFAGGPMRAPTGLGPRLGPHSHPANLAAPLMAATVAALALSGALSDLAIAREFENRRGMLFEAMVAHAAYAVLPTIAAAFVAVPLGRLASTRPAIARPAMLVASAAQTVPTLSLLGLMMVPLASLKAAFPALGAIGFGGTGWAPASIALFLYALLPIAANSRAAFAGVPEPIRDAALGVGMTGRQVFARIELPFAAPALVAGLRIAIAQNVGNAILAGLVGGGGLGGIVFLGLAQAAPDLTLLGALPAVGAAFVADRSLAALERRAGTRIGLSAAAGGA